MITRRTFIMAGVAGSAALAGAYWWSGRHAAAPATRDRPVARPILRALIPAMLAGALPDDPEQRHLAIDSALSGVLDAIAFLPPAAQRELDELFALLAFAPGRIAFAGLVPDWSHADAAACNAVLDRWRTSALALRSSAYNALHQLIFAAWYASPGSWRAIGYPGAPELA